MIEIITGWRSRVIGMRVVVSDYAEPSAARIIIGAFVLLRRDQVSSLTRLGALVLSSVNLGENIAIALAFSEKKPAAFVRISSLAVFSYFIEVS